MKTEHAVSPSTRKYVFLKKKTFKQKICYYSDKSLVYIEYEQQNKQCHFSVIRKNN